MSPRLPPQPLPLGIPSADVAFLNGIPFDVGGTPADPADSRMVPSLSRASVHARSPFPLAHATEVPLAAADPTPGRHWNPWEIASIRGVDTAGIGPLTVGYGDSDGPSFPASAGGFAR